MVRIRLSVIDNYFLKKLSLGTNYEKVLMMSDVKLIEELASMTPWPQHAGNPGRYRRHKTALHTPCSQCGSHHITQCRYGRKVGGTVATTAGAISAVNGAPLGLYSRRTLIDQALLKSLGAKAL